MASAAGDEHEVQGQPSSTSQLPPASSSADTSTPAAASSSSTAQVTEDEVATTAASETATEERSEQATTADDLEEVPPESTQSMVEPDEVVEEKQSSQVGGTTETLGSPSEQTAVKSNHAPISSAPVMSRDEHAEPAATEIGAERAASTPLAKSSEIALEETMGNLKLDEGNPTRPGAANEEDQPSETAHAIADQGASVTEERSDEPPVEDSALATNPKEAASEDQVAQETSAPPLLSPPLPTKETSLPPPPIPTKPQPSGTPVVTVTGESQPSPVVGTQQESDAVARAFGVSTEEKKQSDTPSAEAGPSTPKAAAKAAKTRTPSSAGIRIGKGPPPTTMPKEERPFDFNVFLEQMKDSSARGVGEYVRSFIKGFSKKPYRTTDQIKLIFDFLDFIAIRMRQCQVWANLSENDFENAKEAMEKLVMNRLYGFTFTPAVAKEGKWMPQTDDLERDRVLKERIELFSWIKEEHLDVPTGDHSKGFIDFATQELLKINHYKAPRDKLICILNCCKVIFGLIRHLSGDEGADTFVPILIFVVLKANPEHLISNVEYIGRFRNPEKLSSESGYYLSSLMGATAFIETMDYSSLSNITQEEFEKNVEDAVTKLGAQPKPEKIAVAGTLAPEPRRPNMGHLRVASTSDPHAPTQVGEESAETIASSGPVPANAANFADDTRMFLQRTGEAARTGITNSLGKPIGALGKLLGDGIEIIRTPSGQGVSAAGSGSSSPGRVESPVPPPNPPIRKGLFGGFFGGEAANNEQGQNARSTASFDPTSWSRSFRSVPGHDDDEPQTPMMTDGRKGPFSSLMRSAADDNVPPRRKIGETPYAPRAPRSRPVPQREDSLDPFNSPDPGSANDGAFSRPAGKRRESDIGTPSEGSSDEEEGQERRKGQERLQAPPQERQTSSSGGSETEDGPLARARRRLPDFGAFVPSFLTEPNLGTSPAPSRFQDYPGNSVKPETGRGPQLQQRLHQQLVRGPQEGQATQIGDSSVILQPSSDTDVGSYSSGTTAQDADLSSNTVAEEVERIQEEQMIAGMETLQSVFPGMDGEVRRMVLEASNGDVGQAIDRLLEMNEGA